MKLFKRFLLLAVLGLALIPSCAGDEGSDLPAPDSAPAPDPGRIPDAGLGPEDAAPGSLPFLATCRSNEDCESGLCFNFNNKGLHCTRMCQTAADCPAPSPGCNGMNVCKVP